MFPIGLQSHTRKPLRINVSTQVSSWGSFSPFSLGPSLWLDASDLSTITSSSNSVSQWGDKSVNKFAFVQATGANQPTSGTTTKNGLNLVNVNGSQWITLASGWTSEARAVFAVIWLNTPSSFRTYAGARSSNNGGTEDSLYLQFNSRAPILARGLVGDARVYRATGQQVGSPSWNLFEMHVDDRNASKILSLKTSLQTEVTASSTETLKPYSGAFIIGAGYYAGNIVDQFTGSIAELVLFDRTLSTSENFQMNAYLKMKWGF